MTKTEINKCLHCGGESHLVTYIDKLAVCGRADIFCEKCGIKITAEFTLDTSKLHEEIKSAISYVVETWNRRATEEERS